MKKATSIIVSLRKKDMLKIMKWRNDQISVLRQQKKLTNKDQTKYFKKINKDHNKKKPNNVLYSIINPLDNNCIGYGGIVNIDWVNKKGEMSFLLDTQLSKNQVKYNSFFSNFIEFIKYEFFKKLKLNRLFTETFIFRKKHIKILENNGFIKEGILKQNSYKKKFIDSVIHSILRKRKR